MEQPVKTPRPYHSPKHEAMRRATRQSVIAAAGRLFSERGYGGSSIEAIAEAAGVAVPTVYAAFGNKRSILRAMIDAVVEGVCGRHRRWSLDGTWDQVLDALRAGCDEAEGGGGTVSADSTVVRAHQHAAGARKAPAADDPRGGGIE